MLISTLPFDYAVLLDPGDRVRRTRSRPEGSRKTWADRPGNKDCGLA